MSERSRVLVAACAGAIVGGVWGWMYLTERGCRARTQIAPTIDGVIGEIKQVRDTIEKAKTAVTEGRQLLTDVSASLRESA